MKQFYRGDVKSLTSKDKSKRIKARFQAYFSSWWNRIDILLLSYFIIMLCVRFTVVALAGYNGGGTNLSATTPTLPPSRPLTMAGLTEGTQFAFVLNMYSFYFVFWCLRLLQLFAVSESLGPKLIMIRLMINDVLKIFLYIMIFTVAYAVWLKAAMKTVSSDFLLGGNGVSEDDPSITRTLVDLILNINGTDVIYFVDELMEHPFWHLFGESFIDDYDIYLPMRNDTSAYAYDYRVATVIITAPVMRLIYVLVTVVLLLNLMIAIFQYSIDLAQNQADRNWNIYRKEVIFEYHNRAILPAPFSLVLDFGILLCLFYRRCTRSKQLPSLVKRSDRFDCSTLKIRVNGTESQTNPFARWLQFIKEWEKTLQNHHCASIEAEAEKNGGGACSGTGGGDEKGGNQKPTKDAVSSEALGNIEIKDEVRQLRQELQKMRGITQASQELQPESPLPTAQRPAFNVAALNSEVQQRRQDKKLKTQRTVSLGGLDFME